jgi:hypothetical protein
VHISDSKYNILENPNYGNNKINVGITFGEGYKPKFKTTPIIVIKTDIKYPKTT